MSNKKRRFMRLPADWEDLGEDELERLYDRADRVHGILPELPPLQHQSAGDRRQSSDLEDEETETEAAFQRKRPSPGIDRETILDLRDERGD